MPLTKDELKSLTPEQLAEIKQWMQEVEKVEEPNEQPKVEDTPQANQPEEVQEIIEETPKDEPTPQDNVVEEPKPQVDEAKLAELETRFDGKLTELIKTFDDRTKSFQEEIEALKRENAELKRTAPFGGLPPKPSEIKSTKDVENRDSLVEQYKKGYKNQK